jgi:hypothetical protein
MTDTLPDTVARPTSRAIAQYSPATPTRSMTLPLSGWRVDRREDHDGRAVLEVTDADGDLVALAGSTRRPMLSVDAAWRGVAADAEYQHRWWALAIGHAGSNGAPPAVTFTRRVTVTGSIRRTVVEPYVWHGLWIAAVPGLYTSISCSQDGAHRLRRLGGVPTFGHP